jgi:hypothetical protein
MSKTSTAVAACAGTEASATWRAPVIPPAGASPAAVPAVADRGHYRNDCPSDSERPFVDA